MTIFMQLRIILELQCHYISTVMHFVLIDLIVSSVDFDHSGSYLAVASSDIRLVCNKSL